MEHPVGHYLGQVWWSTVWGLFVSLSVKWACAQFSLRFLFLTDNVVFCMMCILRCFSDHYHTCVVTHKDSITMIKCKVKIWCSGNKLFRFNYALPKYLNIKSDFQTQNQQTNTWNIWSPEGRYNLKFIVESVKAVSLTMQSGTGMTDSFLHVNLHTPIFVV